MNKIHQNIIIGSGFSSFILTQFIKKNYLIITTDSELIKKYWFLKQRVNPFVNNEKIQSLYDLALANGALSGKIMGAGSSGFFLFVVPEETHFNFIDNLKMFKISKIKFDFDGVKVDKLSSLYEK